MSRQGRPWRRPLAQTWLISLMFCSKHIAHYRASRLIRAYCARAGCCVMPTSKKEKPACHRLERRQMAGRPYFVGIRIVKRSH